MLRICQIFFANILRNRILIQPKNILINTIGSNNEYSTYKSLIFVQIRNTQKGNVSGKPVKKSVEKTGDAKKPGDGKKAEETKKPAHPGKPDDTSKKPEEPKPEKKSPQMRTFSIYRWKPGEKARMQNYTIDINNCGGPMLLNALIYIKATQDPTLCFRRSCREGVCGSCAMNVNGLNTLACICPISKAINKVRPLPHMYVARDLITDMNHFYNQFREIQPWLQRANETTEGKGFHQYLQHEKDHMKLNGLYQCILCACCQTACPSYWYTSQRYLGPAILLQAYRWIVDSRDNAAEYRLSLLNNRDKVFRCRTIMNCTNCCPMDLNPGLAIARLKKMLARWEKKQKPQMETLGLYHDKIETQIAKEQEAKKVKAKATENAQPKNKEPQNKETTNKDSKLIESKDTKSKESKPSEKIPPKTKK